MEDGAGDLGTRTRTDGDGGESSETEMEGRESSWLNGLACQAQLVLSSQPSWNVIKASHDWLTFTWAWRPDRHVRCQRFGVQNSPPEATVLDTPSSVPLAILASPSSLSSYTVLPQRAASRAPSNVLCLGSQTHSYICT